MAIRRTTLSGHLSFQRAAATPSGTPNDEGDGDGREHQFEGRGKCVADVVVDRPLGEQRLAEIALRQPGDEAAVLLDDRPVEAELLRRSSTCSWLARGPSASRAGSPGMPRAIAKITIDRPNSTSSDHNKRLTRKSRNSNGYASSIAIPSPVRGEKVVEAAE